MDIIIQARTTSTRLPNKVVKKLHNHTELLELEIYRLKKVKNIRNIILATTTNNTDDILVELAKRMDIKFFRGSENNVLERYYLASLQYQSEGIVRITADCPFIDYEILEQMVDCYNSDNYDYLSNTIERTYPRGLDIEIFSSSVLKNLYNRSNTGPEREHVTTYIYKNMDNFKIHQYKNNIDYSQYRWTVDTIEDYELIYKMYEMLDRDDFLLKDCINIMTPQLHRINNHIEQKKV